MLLLKEFIATKSLRRQYLFLAVLMAVVIISYTWLTGVWVGQTGLKGVKDIEKRYEAADLNHQIRRAIIQADNALDIFLLAPTLNSRQAFFDEIDKADEYIQDILETPWAADSNILPSLHSLRPILNNIRVAGKQIIEVRTTADLMYPAMRLANGDMLIANRQIMTESENALKRYENVKLKELKLHELQVQASLKDAREMWLRTITAYRLFLINRTGSLYEGALQTQIDDVDVFYNDFEEILDRLNEYNGKYELDLEVSYAIEEMQSLSIAWRQGFKEVIRINQEGQWRADIPLVVDVINPLFNELYEKLNVIDDALKQAANVALVEQTRDSGTFIKSLWGMALFVLLISIISLLVLEMNFIRPIAKVARSMKAEAKGQEVGELPDVNAIEIRDLTDAFVELRQQVHTRQLALEHIAMHDALTSLPNRALLMDRLNQSILNAKRRKRSLALLMLDLDRFKEINDTLGHQTGDALLQQVGSRLRKVLRDSDTVARLGGDEFAVLLPNVHDTHALRIASGIHEQLEKVYEVYEHSLYVGASIGVAIFPNHGDNAETLLQHADVAMYVAKRSNTGINLYDIERDEHSVKQLSVLSELRGAIENNEFFLEYQPKLSMQDGSITGAEALIRWNHPKHGLIMPDYFINAAEQTGLIKRVSGWVLDRSIEDCKYLHNMGHKITVTVNLSVWDIQEVNISETITQKLLKWNLPADAIAIEITERVMMAEPERAREVLNTLDAMGIQVIIDDFGTGFSSLVYLKQLPVSTLKIDKSFVIDMMRDESDAAIVHSIIELAHNLGLQVVAEGVESDQSWSWLKTWGCDYAQGFYISHPLSLPKFENYLRTYTTNVKLGHKT